eukprot:360240-Ditylum_brightwellii.AAC.1
MALTVDQIAAIAAAAIQAAGLTPGEQSFLDNPFADEINPATKNRLLRFNAATAAVASEKRISMETKNLQKCLDFFEDQNTRYQWISLTKSVPDKASTNSPTDCDLLKQHGLLSLGAMKHHVHRYYGDDATTNDVPALDSIDIADITPNTENAHKRISIKE